MSLRFLNGLALAVLLVLLLLNCMTVIPEGERGVLYRFGEPRRIGLPPGRYFRLPLADHLERVDVRTRLSDIGRSEYRDADNAPMLAEAWVLWRVHDLSRYARGTGADPERAAIMLLPAVQDGLRRAFATRRWDAHRAGLPDADLRQVAQDSSRRLRGPLGLEIIEVGVRRLAPLPMEQALIVQRMRAERTQDVVRLRTAAVARSAGLRAAGLRERESVLQAAQERVAAQRRETEAAVAAMAMEARRLDPEFHRYWQALETWRRSFGKPGDLFVVGSESELRALQEKSKENTPARGSGVRPR
jgi:membrane protease subunit HflC